VTAAKRKPDECLPVGPAEIADALGVSTRTVYVGQREAFSVSRAGL
jgi:hypothetical protein